MKLVWKILYLVLEDLNFQGIALAEKGFKILISPGEKLPTFFRNITRFENISWLIPNLFN